MEKSNNIKLNSEKAIKELKEAIKDYVKKDKPIKNNAMKKFLILSGLMVLVTFSLIAQEGKNDFVVVGEISSDLNMKQVQARYSARPDVCFIRETDISAMEQITIALKGRSFENMHIFIQSTQNSLIFNSQIITTDNIALSNTFISKWKSSLSGMVFIHCTTELDQKTSAELKQKFESITGMVFNISR